MTESTATDSERTCLTVQEVAARVGICETLVRRAIHAGELRASRLGRSAYRIRLADMEAWLDRAAVQPATKTPDHRVSDRASPLFSSVEPRWRVARLLPCKGIVP